MPAIQRGCCSLHPPSPCAAPPGSLIVSPSLYPPSLLSSSPSPDSVLSFRRLPRHLLSFTVVHRLSRACLSLLQGPRPHSLGFFAFFIQPYTVFTRNPFAPIASIAPKPTCTSPGSEVTFNRAAWISRRNLLPTAKDASTRTCLQAVRSLQNTRDHPADSGHVYPHNTSYHGHDVFRSIGSLPRVHAFAHGHSDHTADLE